MYRKSFLCLTALFLTLMLLYSPAAAQDADNAIGTDISQQISWIQSSLDDGGVSAKRWQYGWCTVYGGLTYLYAAQSTMLDEFNETEERHDAMVNSVSSFVGLVGTLAVPMKTHTAAETLRALPETTEAEKQTKLQHAEALLKESADREALGRSWQAHAFGAGVSALAGIAVASDDGRGGDGLITFATNLLVSEIQILTTPTRATEAWQRYQQGRPATSSRSDAESRFYVSALPNGLAVHYLF